MTEPDWRIISPHLNGIRGGYYSFDTMIGVRLWPIGMQGASAFQSTRYLYAGMFWTTETDAVRRVSYRMQCAVENSEDDEADSGRYYAHCNLCNHVEARMHMASSSRGVYHGTFAAYRIIDATVEDYIGIDQ